MDNGIFVAKTCGGVVSEILDWVLSWHTPNGSWNTRYWKMYDCE